MPFPLFQILSSFVSLPVMLSGSRFLSVMPVFMGAWCGAVIYILSIPDKNHIQRICYFLVSFLLGVYAHDNMATLLEYGVGKFFNGNLSVNPALASAITAALAVRLINLLSDVIFNKLTGSK